jgi:hypothetical protein
MKQKMLIVLGLIVLGMVAFASSPATAMNGYGWGYPPLPSWSQTLPAYTRFVVLLNMNSEAVLDRETGLVWERSPSTDTFNFIGAQYRCNDLSKGNRMGWRAPTLQELTSLVDLSQSSHLPIGHPFSNVQLDAYWSATTEEGNPTNAWFVNFQVALNTTGKTGKGLITYVWCVRGGQGVNPQ